MRKVTTPPRNVQGSDADRAEGGLDVERAFASAHTHPQHLKGLPRQPNGPNVLDMLLSHVQGGEQEEPELTEEFWYASSLMVGPGDAVSSEPDQEGPPGTEV